MRYYVIFADENAVAIIFSEPKKKDFYCRALMESFYSSFDAICNKTQAKLINKDNIYLESLERGSKEWTDSVLLKLEDGGYWKVGEVGEIVESNEEIDKIVEKYS